MLLVRTVVRESQIHGLGLFADEPVAAGQPVWAFEPLIDRVIAVDDLGRLPRHVAEYLEHYCEYFPESGLLVLSGDGDRYTNHADAPNTGVAGENGPEAVVLALRDIAEGEEITCDYGVIRSLKWSAPVGVAAA